MALVSVPIRPNFIYRVFSRRVVFLSLWRRWVLAHEPAACTGIMASMRVAAEREYYHHMASIHSKFNLFAAFKVAAITALLVSLLLSDFSLGDWQSRISFGKFLLQQS